MTAEKRTVTLSNTLTDIPGRLTVSYKIHHGAVESIKLAYDTGNHELATYQVSFDQMALGIRSVGIVSSNLNLGFPEFGTREEVWGNSTAYYLQNEVLPRLDLSSHRQDLIKDRMLEPYIWAVRTVAKDVAQLRSYPDPLRGTIQLLITSENNVMTLSKQLAITVDGSSVS